VEANSQVKEEQLAKIKRTETELNELKQQHKTVSRSKYEEVT
jgi:hypothetical protein